MFNLFKGYKAVSPFMFGYEKAASVVCRSDMITDSVEEVERAMRHGELPTFIVVDSDGEAVAAIAVTYGWRKKGTNSAVGVVRAVWSSKMGLAAKLIQYKLDVLSNGCETPIAGFVAKPSKTYVRAFKKSGFKLVEQTTAGNPVMGTADDLFSHKFVA